MRINIVILISFITLLSCTEVNQPVMEDIDTNASIVEEIIEVDVLEEQVVEPSLYQLAVQKHEKKSIFPAGVVIQPNDELYAKEELLCQNITKVLENCFVLEYRTLATEIEHVYYFTFDYNGNQLDVAAVCVYAVDLDGEIVFNTDTTFQVNRIIREMEVEGADVIEIEEPKKDTIYYTITKKGLFIKEEKL